MAVPREQDQTATKTKQEIDDFLYELPDNGPLNLELGDKLIQTLGTKAEDFLIQMLLQQKKKMMKF